MVNKIQCRIKVKGRVQGVGFRFMSEKKCSDLGLKGKAENLPDGSVIINVEGEKRGVEDLILYLKLSPGESNVDELNCEFRGVEA
jgi:acylphosphatase